MKSHARGQDFICPVESLSNAHLKSSISGEFGVPAVLPTTNTQSHMILITYQFLWCYAVLILYFLLTLSMTYFYYRTIALLVLFSQFLNKYEIPMPAYSKERGFYICRYPLFTSFPVSLFECLI